MRISDTHRLLFVHVQKTGGKSVDQVLDNALPDSRWNAGTLTYRHATLRRILRNEPELADYWTFGFVRNPWARMLSWWAMICDQKDRAASGDLESRRLIEVKPLWQFGSECPDFENFVLEGTKQFPALRRRQRDYLTAPGKSADFVGRQEAFAEGLQAVLDRVGRPVPSEQVRVNATGAGASYRDAYTTAARRRVAEVFAADCEAFEYRF